MDAFTDQLTEICDRLEELYGITGEKDGVEVSDMNFRDLIPILQNKLLSTDRDELSYQAFPHFSWLSQLFLRMGYANHQRLDYDAYPHQDALEKYLRPFLTKKTITVEARQNVNYVASILEVVEQKHVTLRYGLAYRYLRLFVTAVLFGHFPYSSIFATLILTQMDGGD